MNIHLCSGFPLIGNQQMQASSCAQVLRTSPVVSDGSKSAIRMSWSLDSHMQIQVSSGASAGILSLLLVDGASAQVGEWSTVGLAGRTISASSLSWAMLVRFMRYQGIYALTEAFRSLIVTAFLFFAPASLTGGCLSSLADGLPFRVAGTRCTFPSTSASTLFRGIVLSCSVSIGWLQPRQL